MNGSPRAAGPSGAREPRAPRGAAGRVAAVQRQARQSLVVAAVFTVAAPVVATLPHDTGPWLPLHVFFVGGLLSAIAGATQLLAVTWSAAPSPPSALAHAARWTLAAGAVAIAVGREADQTAVVGAGGAAVGVALVLVAVSLVRIRRGAVTDRFHPAIDAYLAAIAFGLVGSVLGALLGSDHVGHAYLEARDAHVAANLFGLVGIVIAGTLPFFAATQARVKMSPRATPTGMRLAVGALAVAVVVAMVGGASEQDGVAALGFGLYALAVVALVVVLPRVGRKQLAWAGPRLLQLAAGIGWWAVAAALFGLHQLDAGPGRVEILQALAIGGYAQILVASLAYFGPVLLAGGHEVLSAGFRITRSWVGLVAANVAAVAALVGADPVLAIALAVWIADSVARAALLLRLLARTSAPTGARTRAGRERG